MPEITARQVKELRDITGAGMMDAKRALTETGGDSEKAQDLLRTWGVAKAASKAGRATKEGVVHAYVHHSGGIAKQGALVELDCETDFVAKTDDFRTLAREIAMQVVGASPQYVRREDVPEAVVEREKAVYREQVKDKPENIVEKILQGKLNDFYSKICLLDQAWIKDDKKKVSDLVTEAVANLKENITVARFARFAVGEPDGEQ
ncbi:MAG: translation elongation factor Ts [Candidatus Dormibacteraeota bacterium]|nr:translation elongation factor Ts [Candidatus Dormibacteraeota bacterium]MBV8444551.1 translation elongation factor Ts [Candidatus Dormibacteraeota bacterium]